MRGSLRPLPSPPPVPPPLVHCPPPGLPRGTRSWLGSKPAFSRAKEAPEFQLRVDRRELAPQPQQILAPGGQLPQKRGVTRLFGFVVMRSRGLRLVLRPEVANRVLAQPARCARRHKAVRIGADIALRIRAHPLAALVLDPGGVDMSHALSRGAAAPSRV
jgi:hypothetical protein